ncbi:MAG TPA: DMT family transporter, partial [Methylomirabilota bacterium]|nr:DMT family transporter [Methylomirabilota bacterium]
MGQAPNGSAREVVACYEAGATGFHLHRQLTELGVRNHVICPTALDTRGKGVNTDKTDAVELQSRLGRYLAGNIKAISLVRVPTLDEEQRRVDIPVRQRKGILPAQQFSARASLFQLQTPTPTPQASTANLHMNYIFVFLAIAAGACISLQAAANASLRTHLQDARWATFFSICGTIAT